MPRIQLYLDQETYRWAKTLPPGQLRKIIAAAKEQQGRPPKRPTLSSKDLCRRA